jgi:dephospho-CoA kinase
MIIGLSGYARSGKDEIAKILVEDYGYERVAFADKIRDFLYETDPQIGGNRLQHLIDNYGWDVAKSQPEVRYLLQSIGVAARKVFGDSFWINQALNPHIYEHPIVGVNKDIVVTDVRFTNEAEIIKSLGGKIWRIKRNGVEAVNNHVSEHEMDGYQVDMILKNEGTLEDLQKMVRNRMEFALNAN